MSFNSLPEVTTALYKTSKDGWLEFPFKPLSSALSLLMTSVWWGGSLRVARQHDAEAQPRTRSRRV